MKILKYVVPACALFLVSSCGNGFLDLTPISNANELNFYKTQAEIETATASAYNTLYTTYGPLGLPYFFGSLQSDDGYTDDMGSNPADYSGIQGASVRVNNTEVLNAWENYYESLYIINNIIYRLGNTDFNGKEVYEAEMRFLRALYYFDMVRVWGGVPLVTKPIDIAEAYATGRATEEAVYQVITDDLKFGTTNLPVKGKERAKGVITRGAAYALLGKVYLTMGNKQLAEQTLLNIYNKDYKLVGYADLWDLKKKNNDESIFEIQYLAGKGNPYSLYWAMYSPGNNIGAVTSQGGGHNQVTDDLWNAYETGDPRRDISIANGYMKGDKFVPTRYPLKWVDKTAAVDGKREAAGNNFIVLRYADVLLMLSEATGDAKYLNEVRNRVGLPFYGDAGYPAQYNTVALAVEHERHVELAMEYHRFFDLKRTGRAIEVMKNCKKNVTLTTGRLVWPIPEEVIIQNPALAPSQNEAYK